MSIMHRIYVYIISDFKVLNSKYMTLISLKLSIVLQTKRVDYFDWPHGVPIRLHLLFPDSPQDSTGLIECPSLSCGNC